MSNCFRRQKSFRRSRTGDELRDELVSNTKHRLLKSNKQTNKQTPLNNTHTHTKRPNKQKHRFKPPVPSRLYFSFLHSEQKESDITHRSAAPTNKRAVRCGAVRGAPRRCAPSPALRVLPASPREPTPPRRLPPPPPLGTRRSAHAPLPRPYSPQSSPLRFARPIVLLREKGPRGKAGEEGGVAHCDDGGDFTRALRPPAGRWAGPPGPQHRPPLAGTLPRHLPLPRPRGVQRSADPRNGTERNGAKLNKTKQKPRRTRAFRAHPLPLRAFNGAAAVSSPGSSTWSRSERSAAAAAPERPALNLGAPTGGGSQPPGVKVFSWS